MSTVAGPTVATGPALSRTALAGVAAVSCAALALEVLLLRLFSIIQWHHFAYMVISLALLGFGASGSALVLARAWLSRRRRGAMLSAAVALAVAVPLSFLLAQAVPFNPLELGWEPRQWLYGGAIYLILALPFFFAACVIGLALMTGAAQLPTVYAVDLAGAGVGALGLPLLLSWFDPARALAIVAALAWVGAVLLARGRLVRAALLAVAALQLAAPPVTLEPSAYKALSRALAAGGEVVERRSGPRGEVIVMGNERVPLRLAPGMSLVTGVEPPAQLALFVDGDGPAAVNRGQGELGFLDQMPTALPYHLLTDPKVLLLGLGGGEALVQALELGARRVDVVDPDAGPMALLQGPLADFSGGLLARPGVAVHHALGRSFVVSGERSWDLIQLALAGGGGGGLQALGEGYRYTVEAFAEYLDHLAPDGLLMATRWLQQPPRDGLKLFATAIAALELRGVSDPASHLLLLRSWRTVTLLVAREAWSTQGSVQGLAQGSPRLAAIEAFARQRGFDIAWMPGMRAELANRYNVWPEPTLYRGAEALLGSQSRRFMSDYRFFVEPATDDRPFFARFFRWHALPEFLDAARRGGLAQVEWGYVVLVATLVQALLAGLLLVWLPLRSLGAGLPRRRRWRVGFYFGALGLAFLFVEMAFLQRFVLFLGHPVYAGAVVLGGFLVFAGLGSWLSGRWLVRLPRVGVVRGACALIIALSLAFVIALPGLLQPLMGLPVGWRVVLGVALIAPLALAMGVPFPLGLAALASSAPAAVPWAWAINGCASVVSAVLATLLAVHFGFNAVVVAAALFYAVAGVVGVGSESAGSG